MEFELSQLAGPLGGSLALAFALGASAGYKFSERTAVKFALERVDALEAHVNKTEAEYKMALEKQMQEHRLALEAQSVENKIILDSQNQIIHSMQKRIKELEDSRLRIALNTGPVTIDPTPPKSS